LDLGPVVLLANTVPTEAIVVEAVRNRCPNRRMSGMLASVATQATRHDAQPPCNYIPLHSFQLQPTSAAILRVF